MKSKNSDDCPNFIPYDDENMDHVLAGPDYGQPETGSKESAWSEIDSKEYPDYVSEIISKILKRPRYKISHCLKIDHCVHLLT